MEYTAPKRLSSVVVQQLTFRAKPFKLREVAQPRMQRVADTVLSHSYISYLMRVLATVYGHRPAVDGFGNWWWMAKVNTVDLVSCRRLTASKHAEGEVSAAEFGVMNR